MKRLCKIGLVLLAVISAASAQLAVSHAPAGNTTQAKSLVTPPQTDHAVARVNGAILTERDLLREMYAIFPYARQHNGGFPKAMEADIRKGALKMIVFEELAYQEAIRRELIVPTTKLDRALADFRKQFKNPNDYQEFLRSECKGSTKLLRAKVERSLLIDQFLRAEVEARAAVSVAQARMYYEKNPDQFRLPESFAIQTISILPPDKAKGGQASDVHKRAEDALRQARATTNYEEFGVLAEKISEDDYRVMMGDRRTVDRAKLPPEVLQAAQGMQPGQVSGLISLEQGYTIIRLNAHNPTGMQKFDNVKDKLRTRLKQQKSEQLRGALDKRLRTHAKVEEL